MRYTIAIADILDSLCDAVDAARAKIDSSLWSMDDAEINTWHRKIDDAWELLLVQPCGTPREYLTLVVWPNAKTVLELESRSEASVTYLVDARSCQCRGARHVCAHRVAAQLVRRSIDGTGAFSERQAA